LTFSATAGRILVTDASGNERLDTDDGLFHIVGSALTGSVSIPAVSVVNSTPLSDRNRTDTWTLGSCNGACTHVIGAVKFTGSGTWGISFARWTTYMGGDLVWAGTSPGITFGSAGTIGDNINVWVTYRFYVSGTSVMMARRLFVIQPPGSVTLTILAHDIDYNLKAGLFT
jgi:hypothetical protein